MKFFALVPILCACALCLSACVESPEMKAALARDDDDTCRAMTFEPGSGPYQSCRMSLLQNRETQAAVRRAAFSDGLAQIVGSTQVSDAYSHAASNHGSYAYAQPAPIPSANRFQTTCLSFSNMTTCD